MSQQLLRRIFSRMVSSYFAKLNHLDTAVLLTINWFCDSSETFFSFLILDLVAEYFLLYMAFLEYIADWEYLPTDLHRIGFWLQEGLPLCKHFGFEVTLLNFATGMSLLGLMFLLPSI